MIGRWKGLARGLLIKFSEERKQIIWILKSLKNETKIHTLHNQVHVSLSSKGPSISEHFKSKLLPHDEQFTQSSFTSDFLQKSTTSNKQK